MRDLDNIPVGEWTAEEGLWHLEQTFARACKRHPDLMEPYLIAGGGKEGMQRALRETFAARYPVTDRSMTAQDSATLTPPS